MNRDDVLFQLRAVPLQDIFEFPSLGKAEFAGLRAAQLRKTGTTAEALAVALLLDSVWGLLVLRWRSLTGPVLILRQSRAL